MKFCNMVTFVYINTVPTYYIDFDQLVSNLNMICPACPRPAECPMYWTSFLNPSHLVRNYGKETHTILIDIYVLLYLLVLV